MAWFFIALGVAMIFGARKLGQGAAANQRTLAESTPGQLAGYGFKTLGKIWLYAFGGISTLGGLAGLLLF